MRYSIMRKFNICSAHLIDGHEGMCKNIHGHNYVIEIYIFSNTLDALGRVIDFTKLKDTLGKWLMDKYDHALIISNNNQNLLNDVSMINGFGKIYLIDGPTTAENMCLDIFKKSIEMMKEFSLGVSKVRVWETENSVAEITNEQ